MHVLDLPNMECDLTDRNQGPELKRKVVYTQIWLGRPESNRSNRNGLVHKEPLWKGLPWMKDAAGLCLGLVCVTFGLGEPEGLAGSMEAQKHHVLFCSLLLATVCRLEGSLMDFGVFSCCYREQPPPLVS